MGWGGGYYDRTIANLRVVKPQLKVIGVGLQAQQVESVPQGEFDETVDFIVTEIGVIKSSKALR